LGNPKRYLPRSDTANRPGSQTMPECRFNKSAHYQKVNIQYRGWRAGSRGLRVGSFGYPGSPRKLIHLLIKAFLLGLSIGARGANPEAIQGCFALIFLSSSKVCCASLPGGCILLPRTIAAPARAGRANPPPRPAEHCCKRACPRCQLVTHTLTSLVTMRSRMCEIQGLQEVLSHFHLHHPF
jgi:hypothetical protein